MTKLGRSMSDLQLRDEAVTILIAGHETTANVLAWALHLLGHDPVIQRQVRDESRLSAAAADGGRCRPAAADPRGHRRAIRLYPPAWMLGRSAQADDTVGPYSVKGGQFVLVSP